MDVDGGRGLIGPWGVVPVVGGVPLVIQWVSGHGRWKMEVSNNSLRSKKLCHKVIFFVGPCPHYR